MKRQGDRPKAVNILLSLLGFVVFVASIFFFSGSKAYAAPILEFSLDTANSTISLTQSSAGPVCSFTNCGIDAELAPDFGGNFSLGPGETETFDFILWTGTGYGGSAYDVTATLAFLAPIEATTSSSGGGAAALLNGSLIAGALFWDNLPSSITLNNGSVINIGFSGGIDFLSGNSIITSASVTVLSIPSVAIPPTAVTAIPEPPTYALFGIGVVLLGTYCARRRLRFFRQTPV